MKEKLKAPDTIFKKAETTGELIRAWRRNFDVSQENMATACGISQGNLSSIENDKREIGARTALRLSAVTGIAPDIILYPNGFETEPEFKEVQRRAKKMRSVAS